MTTSSIPGTVSQRKRAMRIGDGAVAALVMAAALHFPAQGVSNLLWMLGSLAAALGIYALRKSIGHSDLPEAELDEYELKRHLEAREDGLRWSLGLSLATFVLSGVVAFCDAFLGGTRWAFRRTLLREGRLLPDDLGAVHCGAFPRGENQPRRAHRPRLSAPPNVRPASPENLPNPGNDLCPR